MWSLFQSLLLGGPLLPFLPMEGLFPLGGLLFPGRDPGPSAPFKRILDEWKAAHCPRPSAASLVVGSLSIP